MKDKEIEAQLERLRYAGEQGGIIKGIKLVVTRLSGTISAQQADLIEEAVKELMQKWDLEDTRK